MRAAATEVIFLSAKYIARGTILLRSICTTCSTMGAVFVADLDPLPPMMQINWSNRDELIGWLMGFWKLLEVCVWGGGEILSSLAVTWLSAQFYYWEALNNPALHECFENWGVWHHCPLPAVTSAFHCKPGWMPGLGTVIKLWIDRRGDWARQGRQMPSEREPILL